MKVKANELQHMLLDYAVAQCENLGYWAKPEKFVDRYQKNYNYCRFHYSWALSGEIIEREWINITNKNDIWCGEIADNVPDGYISANGETPLIAAMRVYVASKLGDIVEIPEGVAQAYDDQVQAIKAMGTVAN